MVVHIERTVIGPVAHGAVDDDRVGIGVDPHPHVRGADLSEIEIEIYRSRGDTAQRQARRRSPRRQLGVGARRGRRPLVRPPLGEEILEPMRCTRPPGAQVPHTRVVNRHMQRVAVGPHHCADLPVAKKPAVAPPHERDYFTEHSSATRRAAISSGGLAASTTMVATAVNSASRRAAISVSKARRS